MPSFHNGFRQGGLFPALAACVMLGLLIPVTRARAADWMINEDYKQLDARGATDFDIFIRGDVTAQITGGGFSSVTNPFANPTRTQSYDAALNTTTVRFSGTNTIPRDTGVFRHVGIFGNGTKPAPYFKAWSFATAPTLVPVPKSNFAFFYDPTTQLLTVGIQNTSPDTVTFSQVGFLHSSFERPIDDLNRITLPPSAFNPLSFLNGQYLPGDVRYTQLTGFDPSSFALTYGTVQFSGASSNNAYNDVGGEWAQVRVIAQIPEPTGIAAIVGLALPALRIMRRPRLAHHSRGPVARCSAARIVCSAIAVTCSLAAVAAANVFVIPTKAPGAGADTRPRINMTVNIAGVDQNVHVLVDSGAQTGLYVKNPSAGRLGMGAGGAAGGAQGVGGNVPTREGVGVPAGMTANGCATPPGQAAGTPPMPATGTVGPGAPGTDAILGSDFLNAYQWGVTTGANGGYLWLAAKDQGAQAETDAHNIARLLANQPAYVPRADGRPQGVKNEEIVPTPPRNAQPGFRVFDSFFDIFIDVQNPLGGATGSPRFLMKTDVERTCLSQSTAAALGLIPTGSAMVELNFDEFPIPTAPLLAQIFPDLPPVLLNVGILPNSLNPFNDNIMGADMLDQFYYWEINTNDPLTAGTFYAASTIPEPAIGLLTVAIGMSSLASRHARSGCGRTRRAPHAPQVIEGVDARGRYDAK